MAEVTALIAAAPNPKARLIMLEQWRAGLRVSEALALEARDLHLDSDRPTLVVRQGKGRKARVVPVHPELQTALTAATSFGAVGQGRLIEVSRVTVWRWVQQAVLRATEAGQIPQGRGVGTHTLRHSFARHMLLNGIPLNYLSRWLGHGRIPDHIGLLGVGAGPVGESGVGALIHSLGVGWKDVWLSVEEHHGWPPEPPGNQVGLDLNQLSIKPGPPHGA